VDPAGRLHTFCHAVRGKWHMMGVTLSAGGSLQWYRNAVCETLKSVAKKQKVDAYDLLTEEAAVTPPGAEGLFFLPYLAGERTPHADPLARGAFRFARCWKALRTRSAIAWRSLKKRASM
jgi:xylulokinase